MRGYWSIAGALLLGSCAAPPPAPPLTAEQAALAPTDKLCWGYHGYAQINGDAARQSMIVIRAELSRRNEVSASEWALIDAHNIKMGIHRCAVLALYGQPTVSSEIGRIQTLAFDGLIFVTFTDGGVSGFQGPTSSVVKAP